MNEFEIIRPDDWHVHFRDNEILSADQENLDDVEAKEQDVKTRANEHVDTYRNIVDILIKKPIFPQSKYFAEMLDEVVLFGLLMLLVDI